MMLEVIKQTKPSDMAATKMAERKDLLILAHQKLDEINRGNLGLSGGGGRPGSAASNNRRRKSAISSHLLSTLLYLALMAHKLEDMKTMLEEEDGDTYNEWRCLLETLHSPEFHARERIVQNQRVKRTFERKRRYKEEAMRLREELSVTSMRLTELQKLSNETNNQMSKTISSLMEERAALVTKDEERQYQMEELREEISGLRTEAELNDAKVKSLKSEVERNNECLEGKNQSIIELETEVTRLRQDAAVSRTKLDQSQKTLDETKSNLETSKAEYAAYQAEKEPLIRQLQQDLTESQSSNAILNTRLEAANESLAVAKKQFDDNQKTLLATTASFDELRSQSDNLKDIVQCGISKLDDGNARTKSMLEEVSKVHLQKMFAHNDQVTTSLAILPELLKQTSLLGSTLDAVREVVSTLSSTTALEKFSSEIQQGVLRVKQTLDSVSEHQRNDGLRQDLLEVQQRLDGIAEFQREHSPRKGLMNVQERLNELHEYHKKRDDDLHHEVSSMEQRLGGIFEIQQKQNYGQELLNVQQSLEEVSERQQNDVLRQDLLNVQNKLEEVARLQQQQNDSQVLLDVKKSLGKLFEYWRYDELHNDMSDVQKRLDTISELQRQQNCSQELANVKQSLDELSKHQQSANFIRQDLADVQQRIESIKKPDQSEHDRLLKKILQSINGVYEECTRMESTIYETNCNAEELVETICNTVGNLSERCISIKSDFETALGRTNASECLTRGDDENNACEPNMPPSRTEMEEAKDHTLRRELTMSTSSVSTSANEMVDDFLSEAVRRL